MKTVLVLTIHQELYPFSRFLITTYILHQKFIHAGIIILLQYQLQLQNREYQYSSDEIIQVQENTILENKSACKKWSVNLFHICSFSTAYISIEDKKNTCSSTQCFGVHPSMKLCKVLVLILKIFYCQQCDMNPQNCCKNPSS